MISDILSSIVVEMRNRLSDIRKLTIIQLAKSVWKSRCEILLLIHTAQSRFKTENLFL